MKLIIDPVTSNKLSIYSYEGRQVLKKYVSLYQTGGANETFETFETLKEKINVLLNEYNLINNPESTPEAEAESSEEENNANLLGLQKNQVVTPGVIERVLNEYTVEIGGYIHDGKHILYSIGENKPDRYGRVRSSVGLPNAPTIWHVHPIKCCKIYPSVEDIIAVIKNKTARQDSLKTKSYIYTGAGRWTIVGPPAGHKYPLSDINIKYIKQLGDEFYFATGGVRGVKNSGGKKYNKEAVDKYLEKLCKYLKQFGATIKLEHTENIHNCEEASVLTEASADRESDRDRGRDRGRESDRGRDRDRDRERDRERESRSTLY
jgi:hypothetical protein